ncbi:hypothetical protein SAMN05892883_1711 [Jatrophihabitans sp. GAS493]|uniref:maltokinase N-terminal cap-like domain-containing protein n=1 Tax=Jatrophihabitans sp. GAS493 TaxID=1907575 RepID=UPI000BB92C06|nr:1,4-alpha-glucan branching protein [Jatrophihabitans sp. GAS493]SOD72306.1 hypothetical protein SAMN05892883_1711 [Jatrophihabitans sp. GAS493]
MAEVHNTTMKPGKLELLTDWLPTRPWYVGNGSPSLRRGGGFRLDDPAGEVGIEFLIAVDEAGDEPVSYLVPQTYRDAPVDGAAGDLIGTSEHGVLGLRYIYDGTRDPVLINQLIAFLQGKVDAQAQSQSNTLDPSIRAKLTATQDLVVVSSRATDTTTSTDILVETADGPKLTLRINRRLAATPTADPERVGEVVGEWQTSDGTEARGEFVAVHPAG